MIVLFREKRVSMSANVNHKSTVNKRLKNIPAGVTGIFIDIKSFRSRYGPGVDSASNRNEYQEYFLGVKAAGAYG